ncbi:sorting nexin-24-like [Bacillus rossius redtenbacheri]|uniref:sorting nexin-24-like n=1 Tax=Bacillus rossius redtenbacheri TaxID=93214 RepID=UPI002FDE00DC
MTQIYIPQYRLVDEPPGKPHYVYVIEVVEAGQLHKVERRYSAFHCLHRELRKHLATPLFPPKRVRSCQRKVLERRRQCLEQYLRAVLRAGPGRAQVLAFLGLPPPGDETEECASDVPVEPVIEHRGVYTYESDPYLESEACCSLPDVVAQGVLSGLYDSWK